MRGGWGGLMNGAEGTIRGNVLFPQNESLNQRTMGNKNQENKPVTFQGVGDFLN